MDQLVCASMFRSGRGEFGSSVWVGMFVEDAYGVLVVPRVAQALQPVGNDVLRQHHPGDVADDVLAEGDGLDSRRP